MSFAFDLAPTSLLDSIVKIFFVDTLKFLLSLYSHKFPVLCMGISYDSTTIVTGGVDRNIKIWGLVATTLFQVLWYILKVAILALLLIG